MEELIEANVEQDLLERSVSRRGFSDIVIKKTNVGKSTEGIEYYYKNYNIESLATALNKILPGGYPVHLPELSACCNYNLESNNFYPQVLFQALSRAAVEYFSLKSIPSPGIFQKDYEDMIMIRSALRDYKQYQQFCFEEDE